MIKFFYSKTFILLVSITLFIFCSEHLTAKDQAKAKRRVKVYRARQLGDKAFKNGLYKLASKFYTSYQKEAANDPDARIDASKCLIAAYVRSGNAVSARDVFNKLTTMFAARISKNQTLRNRLSYWDANIQMSNGEFKKAADIFKHLLNTIKQNTTLYFKTLDALGSAQARRLDWDKAEKTYALLEFAGKKTKWQKIATRKRLISLLMACNYTRARMVIKALPKEKNKYIKIIETLILVKEHKLKLAAVAYKKIRKLAMGSDPLWYMLSFSLATAYLQNKDYKNALLILNDSVLFANSEFERQQALITIINSAILADNIKAAASTAEKFLQNYPESFLSNEIRLKLANLYINEKQSDDALQVYETVINDKNANLATKITSARSAAHVFIAQKRYSEAKEKFAYISKVAKDDKTKGEGQYWIAELLYIQSKYNNAAEAFGQVAANFEDWREQALFKQIKSLMNTKHHSDSIYKIQNFLKKYPHSKDSQDAAFLYALALKNDKKFHDAQMQFAQFAKKYKTHAYAPRALFEEGNLALNHGDEGDAVSAYTELIKRYPGDSLVPNSLYRRMYVCFLNSAPEIAISDTATLFSKYQQSVYSIYAGFRLADYYVAIKKYDKAVVLLRKMQTMYKTQATVASKILYEIANTYFKEGNHKEALKTLNELSEKFPKSDIANNGLFLRGDIYSQKSDYEKAIPFFKKAAANPADSLLETAAWGRIGDSYFALGWKTPDGTNYLKASDFYNKILEKKKLKDRFRIQALYKLGRCEELLGDKGKALSKYHEAIIYYELDSEEGRMTAKSSKWFVKASLAAAILYLQKDTQEAAEAAIVIYKSLIQLHIPPINDYKKQILQISEKYNLKE